MKAEIVTAKGDACCRMCDTNTFINMDRKQISLRGKKCLKIVTDSANGESTSFYCLECARKIKKCFIDMAIY